MTLTQIKALKKGDTVRSDKGNVFTVSSPFRKVHWKHLKFIVDLKNSKRRAIITIRTMQFWTHHSSIASLPTMRPATLLVAQGV